MEPRNRTPVRPLPGLATFRIRRDTVALRTRRTVERALVARALRSETFRRELLGDPRGTLERQWGAALPSPLDVRVLEETEASTYVVIPANPYDGISEGELEARLDLTLQEAAEAAVDQQALEHDDRAAMVALVLRAWRDPEFRQALRERPDATLGEIPGIELPDRLRVHVVFEDPERIYLLLPFLADEPIPAYGTAAEDLEVVASILDPCFTDTGFESVGSCGQ